MPLTRVNDIELHYESHGSGDPLLLIGGLGLAVSEVRPLTEALAAGHRVIAVENRGVGRSAKPPGRYSIEQMADDAAALAAQLGLSRAHVLGISMGGRIAMSLALDHPGLVAQRSPNAANCRNDLSASMTTRHSASPGQRRGYLSPFAGEP